MDGRLGCYHFLGIVNNAAVKMGVQIAFQVSVFVSSGCIPRSGIAASYGSSLLVFFLEALPYCFL